MSPVAGPETPSVANETQQQGDFPPLLTTQTNMAMTMRSKHSDDEVEVRRALEESENALRSDLGK